MAERKRFIPIARPDLGPPEAEAAGRAILSGWVTQGPEVAAFEREFAEYAGAAHACAVSSGTTALHLALLVAGVQPGDEVATASHSFIATANAVRHCGALPVFVDVQPGTFNMDPGLLERALSPRTRVILCVHQLGLPCDLAAILEIAERRRITVVEDAACALGSELLWQGSWQRVGRPHAALACFSFHPRKAVTTGDGGMITTANPEWDQKLRLLRHHGMRAGDAAAFESYSVLGFNYRMSDIQAAVGREQLKRLPGLLERRRALAQRYAGRLAGVPGLRLPEQPAWARTNWQSLCVRLPPGVEQRAAMQLMLDRGVATRRGVMCAHREPAYPRGSWSCGVPPGGCDCAEGSCARLAASEQAQDGCLMLPLFSQMADDEVDAVVEALGEACRRGPGPG